MKKRLTMVSALFCCALFFLSACAAPPASIAGTEPTDAAVSDTQTAEPAQAEPQEQIELTLWDSRTEEANSAMIESIIAGFEAKYPNIKVKHSPFRLEELRNTIKPALNSGEGPDIFSYDVGAGYLGVLADADMVLDMTSYAEQFKWADRFHDWALKKAVYGSKLYGVANELEVLGVFYNKEMFAQIGATPPKTYAEFLSLCEAFKQAGIQPLIMEDKDQWQGFHYESIWLNSFVGPDQVKQAIAGEIPWTTEGFGAALDQLASLYTSGYATANPLSIVYEDANRSFYAGEGAMRVTGTWIVPDFVDNMGENVGFFYLPMGSEDLASCPPGGLGDGVVVNAKTAHPDEAMLFVDYMFSPENMKIWYEAGLLPAVKGVDTTGFSISPLFREIIDTLNNAENLGENIDVLMSAGINDVTKNYIQQLIAGKIDGAACMEQKQKIYEEEVAAGNF